MNPFYTQMNMSELFTTKEKEKIFIGRTQTFWPENWQQYEELISHELWSKEQMAEYNFKKRLEMLAYAYEHSPFYHRLYSEQGIHPNDVKTEADWEKLPIVTKAMLRDAGETIIVESKRDSLMVYSTGGSTGHPLKVYRDIESASFAYIGRVQGWWSGRRPGELLMPDRGIIGQDWVYLTRDGDTFAKNAIRRYPQRYVYLDVWNLSNEDMARYVKALQSFKDDSYHIRAYTGGMQCFAQYCYDRKIKLPRPLSLYCTAAIMTEYIRNLIHAVFQCEPMDAYGSYELGVPVATEHSLDMTSHNLYVQDDLYYMELVNKDGDVVHNESEGVTIVTYFLNHVAPLIRYNQGDRTHHIRGEDPLHLPFSRIAPIQGRENVHLIARDGSKVYISAGSFNTYPDCVKAFQFRQKEPGNVRLVVVENMKHPTYKEEINTVYQMIKTTYADRFDLTLEVVETIEPVGGKLNNIILE